jgi:endoglucanase
MDDRVGCAVLVQVMRKLAESPHEVSFVFTVQEEVGTRGAITSAYGIDPDVAIAVDITPTGDTPEARTMSVALGKGPAVKVKDRGMIAHAGLKNHLFDIARELGLPCQPEVLELGSTDAMAMQMTRGGVPAGVVSIPTRYAHTPSEMVDLGDVDGAVNLLVAFLSKPNNLLRAAGRERRCRPKSGPAAPLGFTEAFRSWQPSNSRRRPAQMRVATLRCDHECCRATQTGGP